MGDDVLLPSVGAALALLLASGVTVHVLWTKKEPRASFGWIGLAWLSPVIGAVLYMLFGINRIRRKARSMRTLRRRRHERPAMGVVTPENISLLLPEAPQLASLAHALETVTHRPLVGGNEIAILQNGDETYPAMLEAIEGAQHSIAMQSYIFESRGPGKRFVEAIVAAKARGVEVRVLLDAAGERYGYPRTSKIFLREKVSVARFLPAFPPWRWPYVNLRNHRKILVVDGQVGFTGGLNVRPDHVLAESPESPTRDVHFRFRGPVAKQLMQVFAEDWFFTTREHLDGELWFPEIPDVGNVPARAVADGPDEDFDKARWAMLSGVACARHRVAIVTPYFLPDEALITALSVAARRGVKVDLVLPAKGNLRFVDWAMTHLLENATLDEVDLWRTDGDFDHSKLMVVDGAWCFVGSANWDTRSLRLNFELNVECYDRALGSRIEALIDAKIEAAHRASPVRARPAARLRNALFGLFTPYL